jgi:transposase-like protein
VPARRYTDQQFVDAVADPEVRTVADLCRRLGIVPRGGNYDTLRRVADRLGMTLPASTRRSPVTHQHRLGPTPSHTDAQLLAAICEPQVDSYPALCRELGLRPHPTTHARLRARAEALGSPLPASWSEPGPKQRIGDERRFATESLSTALLLARTRKEVLEFLGVAVTGASYRRLAQQLHQDGLDHSHLNPHATRAAPLEDVLVRGRGSRTSNLRRRLIREGVLEARCSRCLRTEWEGEAIPLELDHIDGDRWNNDVRNLRLLCPNCHALTPTYRGRNIGRHPR